MLVRTVDGDISGCFVEIQSRVDSEHAKNQVVSGEHDSLAMRVKTLEARVAVLEVERAGLVDDMEALRTPSLDKAGCAHIDALAALSVAVATTEEVVAAHRRTRGVSKVLLRDFGEPRGQKDATMSFQAVQAQQAKGKALARDAAGGCKGARGDTGLLGA